MNKTKHNIGTKVFAKVFHTDKHLKHLWLQATSMSLLNRPVVPCIPLMDLSDVTNQGDLAHFAVYNFLTQALRVNIKSSDIKSLGVYKEGDKTYYYFLASSDKFPNPDAEAFKKTWKSVLTEYSTSYRPYQVGIENMNGLLDNFDISMVDITDLDRKVLDSIIAK